MCPTLTNPAVNDVFSVRGAGAGPAANAAAPGQAIAAAANHTWSFFMAISF
jgi:hypothetical protein